jgi:hypothetical protein
LGLGAGYVGTAIVRPPPFPEVGSDADLKQLSKLAADIDRLPIVRDLRGKATKQGKEKSDDAMRQGDAALAPAGGELAYEGGDDEAWIELPATYETSNTLVNGSMSGTRGLGVQRAFWSPVRKELVMLIWFGGGLSGWPGITHGGAIATMFTEAMKRAVQCTHLSDGQSGKFIFILIAATVLMNIPADLDSPPTDPSSLSLTYLYPTKANALYVLRAQLTEREPTPISSIASDKDLTKKHHKQTRGITAQLNRRFEVDGTIENTDGKPCVKAKATWDIL